jgi:uncharacterized protein (DUF1778 family)
MALIKAEERIPARMPQPVYKKIVEAAQSVGATLNQFLVQAALEKANEILEQERIITLSAKAAKNVFDLMQNPPAPKERLTQAMRRREALLCRK